MVAMATATTVPIEVYLRSSYEPDADFYEAGNLEIVREPMKAGHCQINFEEIAALAT